MGERRYRDGDVIYRAGDRADAAFIIVGGQVQITPAGEASPSELTVLGPGDMFGEPADGGLRRTESAQAVGPATLQDLPLAGAPEVAGGGGRGAGGGGPIIEGRTSANPLGALSGFLSRLLAPRGPRPPAPRPSAAEAAQAAPAGGLGGWFKALVGADKAPAAQRFDVRVAPLPATGGADLSRAVVAALNRDPHLKARRLPRAPLVPHEGESPADQEARGRGWLAQARADMLVWSDGADGTALSLRLVPLYRTAEDRPGEVAPGRRLLLPLDPGRLPEPALVTFALAAASPVRADQARARAERLAEWLSVAAPLADTPPGDLAPPVRASILAAVADASAAVALAGGAPDLLAEAARRYRTALAGLPAGTEAAPDPAADLDRALVSKALGLALLASADLSRDTQALDDAVTTLRDVVDRLDRKADGRTWSLAQYRLGQALYRQDLLTDDGDLLRDALNAFQAALTAIDRAKTPVLWADAKTGFARAAQIIGRESRNAEILERAAEACRAALEERNRERAPLPWAATQNNLGSALFLLAHIGGDMALLEDAAQAFTEARDLYQAMGAERQAAIAARNLARARGVPPEADGTGLTGDAASGPDGSQRGAGPAADGAEPKQRQPMWFELEDTAAPDVTRASGSPSPPSPDGAPPEGTP